VLVTHKVFSSTRNKGVYHSGTFTKLHKRIA